jgi:hypothetical protein
MFSVSPYVCVLFTECTSGGPPTYVCTINNSVHSMQMRMSARKDRSIRLLDLAYVRPKSPNYPSSVLSDPNLKLILLTKLPMPN